MSGQTLQTAKPPLIPGSINIVSAEIDKLAVDEIDVSELEVDTLTATQAVFSSTVHDNLEVSNTIQVSGTITATQADAFQYLFTDQNINGEGITKNSLYTGLETPFGDKLFYKTPTNFFQLLTPLNGTHQFTTGSPTLVLTSTEGVGIVHDESRVQIVTEAKSDLTTAHTFVVSIVQNTSPYVGGTNFPGNGTVTITIVPALAGGNTVDIRWFLDGRLEIEP